MLTLKSQPRTPLIWGRISTLSHTLVPWSQLYGQLFASMKIHTQVAPSREFKIDRSPLSQVYFFAISRIERVPSSQISASHQDG